MHHLSTLFCSFLLLNTISLLGRQDLEHTDNRCLEGDRYHEGQDIGGYHLSEERDQLKRKHKSVNFVNLFFPQNLPHRVSLIGASYFRCFESSFDFPLLGKIRINVKHIILYAMSKIQNALQKGQVYFEFLTLHIMCFTR